MQSLFNCAASFLLHQLDMIITTEHAAMHAAWPCGTEIGGEDICSQAYIGSVPQAQRAHIEEQPESKAA